MLRICHLSDLHISSHNGRENIRRTEKVLNYAMNIGFDHLVITGDLVHNPNPDDFGIARSIFNDFGLLRTDKLSLTIGNHEIYGGIHFFKEIMSFPKKSYNVNYVTQVARFVDYFPEAFENIQSVGNESIFPYAKRIRDTVLIGVNTTAKYSFLHNPLASRGVMSRNRLSELDSLLRLPICKAQNKAVLAHHHFCEFDELSRGADPFKLRRLEFETLKMRGKNRLLELLNEHNVQAVLHGHVHRSVKYNKKGIVFSNAGGTVDNWNAHIMAVNFLNISSQTVEASIHTFSTNMEPIFEENYGGEIMPEYAN